MIFYSDNTFETFSLEYFEGAVYSSGFISFSSGNKDVENSLEGEVMFSAGGIVAVKIIGPVPYNSQ